MANIAIFGVSNGVGITRDMGILHKELTKAGHDVDSLHCFKSDITKVYDLGIWLERFNPRALHLCKKNAMIPNQEWFEPEWMPHLKDFDVFYTKTKYADDIFRNLNCRTEYISFTSEDRYLPDVKKDGAHWIHIAGKSIQKQTETVIQTWEKNPGYPHLTIIQDPKFWRPRTTSRNINYMIDRVSEDVLKVMQNSNLIHVCPSYTEGFGHYIMEALSCKCIPITTNAAPMNELADGSRGFLVDVVRQEQCKLSVANYISQQTLEKAVIQVIITDDAKKNELGEKAREFFLQNDAFFKRRIVEAVNATLS